MTPAAQLSASIARYGPEVAAVARNAYRRMRRRLPGATALVYHYSHSLVIAFGASERGYEAVLSLALYPRLVKLFFLGGPTLPDPAGLLSGKGKQVRSIVLEETGTLDRAEVRALIDHAVRRADPLVAKPGRGSVVIKTLAKKQRARRP